MRPRRGHRRGVGDEGARAPAGGLEGPLNLIHTNKVPKPVSMRVPARFVSLSDVPLGEVQEAFSLGMLGVLWLVKNRGTDGAT